MREIAQTFAAGFKHLGCQADVASDMVPPLDVPGLLNVVIAPHEFFPLFLAAQFGRAAALKVARGCFCLNTEQPGTEWFDLAFQFAARSKGVFDINRQGVRTFEKHGVPAIYTPLGYAAGLEGHPTAGASERDIDILFLGRNSDRRGRYLARHAETLAKYNCRLILAEADQPRLARTPGYFVGANLHALVRRSKILLNLHADHHRYFEWHRALTAIANHCLLVSDASDDFAPLVPEEHLVFAESDQLMGRCVEFLLDEGRRRAVTDRAYHLLTTKIPAELGCRIMLNAMLDPQAKSAETPPAAGVRRPSVFRAAHWHAARQLRMIKGVARVIRCHGLRSLSRFELAHRLYGPVHSINDRLRGHWSLKDIERRRRAILQRLAALETRVGFDDRTSYDFVPNGLWSSAATPEVSVVVTLHNYERFIVPCLESVAAADCSSLPGGIELVVVNDASTDRSADVASATLARLKLPACLLLKPQNTGLAHSRNLGIARARAPLIFMLDADNWLFPGCLAKLVETLRASDAAAAYGMLCKVDDKTGESLDLLSCYPWDPDRLLTAPYIDAMALFRRDRLLEVGGYSTELLRYGWFGWEDYDLWLKFAQAGFSCTLRPEIIAAYRVHHSSMINITRHYNRPLARYLRKKFADLAQKHHSGRFQFGLPRVRNRPVV